MERKDKGKSTVPFSEEVKRKKNKERWQVEILENTYLITERPSAETKIQLAKMTGLTFKQVQFWFGNKRGSKIRYRPKPGQPPRSRLSRLKPGQEPGQSSRTKLKPGQEPDQCPTSRINPDQEPDRQSGSTLNSSQGFGQSLANFADVPLILCRQGYHVLAPMPISWRPPADLPKPAQPYSVPQEQRRCNHVSAAQPINLRPPFQEESQSSNPQEQQRRYHAPEVRPIKKRPLFGHVQMFKSSQESTGQSSSNPQEQQPRSYPGPAAQPVNRRLSFDSMLESIRESVQPYSNTQGQQRSYPGPAVQHNNRLPQYEEPGQSSSHPHEQQQEERDYPTPAAYRTNRRPFLGRHASSSTPQGQHRAPHPGPKGQHGDWRAPAGRVEVVLPPLRVNGRTVRNGTMFRYLPQDEYEGLLQNVQMRIAENQRQQEMEQNYQGDDELGAEPAGQPSEEPMIHHRCRNRQSTNMASIDLNEPYIPSSSNQGDQNEENLHAQIFDEPSINVPPGFQNLYVNDVEFRRAIVLRHINRSREQRQNNNNNSNIEAPSMEGGGNVDDKGKQPILLDTDSESE